MSSQAALKLRVGADRGCRAVDAGWRKAGVPFRVGTVCARVVCVIAIIALVHGRLEANPANVMDGEILLATLRACDAVYSEGFSAKGTGLFPEDKGIPARRTVWEMTASAKGMVISRKATEMFPPDRKKTVPSIRKSYGSRAGARGVVERQTLHWGPDFSSHLAILRTFEPGSDGRMAMSPQKRRLVNFYSAKGPGLDLFRMQAVFGLGRGFSRYIEKIESVTDSGKKLIRCVGTGRYLAWKGTWELLVDPSLAYLVRDARFTCKEDQAKVLHVRTSGVRWFDGRCIAKNSMWSDSVARDTPQRIPLAVTLASADPNDRLLQKAREEVLGTARMPTMVVDERGVRNVTMLKEGDVYSTLDKRE